MQLLQTANKHFVLTLCCNGSARTNYLSSRFIVVALPLLAISKTLKRQLLPVACAAAATAQGWITFCFCASLSSLSVAFVSERALDVRQR
jgi:hypothetical protein